jgi:hypothetical protein
VARDLVRDSGKVLQPYHTDYYRMMPEDSVYGEWPASGEIDLAEVRGNNGDEYAAVGGRDSVTSAMVSSRLGSNISRTC